MKVVHYLLLSCFLLGLASCANPLPPEGGPRDETPPQVDSLASTPNFQTNFTKQRIELTFDEWVVLKDVFNQVLVSPPLEYKPQVSLRKRTVRVDFDEREELRPDATYTINFGEAIQDLTEGNAAEDLRFVFSTGPYIDSLSVRGKVTDVLTGKPLEDISFMLYKNTADTVVRTERPFYFGRTDKEGRFLIKNIAAGTYKGFALEDANLNYKFDLESEKIGFPDSLIDVSPDSDPVLRLQLFEEAPPLQFVSDDQSVYGRIKLQFSSAPEGVQINSSITGMNLRTSVSQDTLTVWYDYQSEENWRLFVQTDTLRDTILVRPQERAAFLNENQLLVTEPQGEGRRKLAPNDSILIQFSHPLTRIDSTRIYLEVDSTAEATAFRQMRLDTSDQRRLYLYHDWQQKTPYVLRLMAGAVTDMYGFLNDTLRQEYAIGPLDTYGNIQLALTNFDSTQQYVLQLMKGKEIAIDHILLGSTDYNFRFELLSPGSYTLQFIEDEVPNGKWDTGSYNEKRQPEIIYTYELEKLRANWDLEVNLSLTELQQSTEKKEQDTGAEEPGSRGRE